jgi:hypothetical protein
MLDRTLLQTRPAVPPLAETPFEVRTLTAAESTP